MRQKVNNDCEYNQFFLIYFIHLFSYQTKTVDWIAIFPTQYSFRKKFLINYALNVFCIEPNFAPSVNTESTLATARDSLEEMAK